MPICNYDVFYLFLFSLYCRVKFLSRYWYIYFACHIDKTNIIFHDNVIIHWCNIDTIENNICFILRQYNISVRHFNFDSIINIENICFKDYILGKTFFVHSVNKYLILYLLINYHFLLNKEMRDIYEHLIKCQI